VMVSMATTHWPLKYPSTLLSMSRRLKPERNAHCSRLKIELKN